MAKGKMGKKIEDLKYAAINSLIYYNYYHKKIDDNLVYVESRNGKDFTGNILRIVEELSTGKFGNFKIVVYAKKKIHPKIKEYEKNYNLKINKIVSDRTKGTMIMEKSKYIITDSSLFHKFVKRPEQIVLNTWHGNPIRTTGIHYKDQEHNCANVQQCFFSCDYLLYPNEYCKNTILESYMVEKLYPGTILLGGYPRNCVFFKSSTLKNKLNLSGKEIFAYMPIFKSVNLFNDKIDRKNTIEGYFKEIDEKLNENQILFVKLHDTNKKHIDLSNFKHIKEFPTNYDYYDILNMADVLISDYSDVIFDFANTKRKIILFNFDKEKFSKYYDTYLDISDFPFPKVDNVNDLMEEINSPKNYDDREFLEKYCNYDNIGATENLCRHIFKQEKVLKEEIIEIPNKNTLIFGGGLFKNGVTSSLLNILSMLDYEDHNYFVSYRTWSNNIQDNHESIFKLFPDNVEFAPLRTPINPTLSERIKLIRYVNSKKDNVAFPDALKNLFKRELKRSYNGLNFDNMIHFPGDSINEMLLFSQSDSNKIIWVHTDKIEKINLKMDNHNVLKECYNSYNHVVVVSSNLIESTSKISKRKDNISVVNNINNYKQIIENSKKEIEFDSETEMITLNPGGIKGVLESPGKKFITIGRFSYEKNHRLLIKAFNRFSKDYPNTQLIIIGGHGPKYGTTKKLVKKSKFKHNITIIKSIFNPMPILNKCDLFILPSTREGWPVTIMEADSLQIPIIASNIEGLKWLKDFDGYLIENTEEGILQGMYDFIDGKVNQSLSINYENHNQDAINEFLKLLDK